MSKPKNEYNFYSNRIEGVYSNIENASNKMNKLINLKPSITYNIFGPFVIDDQKDLSIKSILSNPILKIPELKKDIPELKNPNFFLKNNSDDE